MAGDTSQGNRRRLQDIETEPLAIYADTVYVTLQINAGSNSRVSTVMGDVQAAMAVTPPYGVVPVQVALSSRSWSCDDDFNSGSGA